MNRKLVVIGVVGGIASGKSVVARRLAEWGAAQLDADRTGHEVLDEPSVRDALVARWGSDILDAEGRVNRRAVASVVFGGGSASQQARAAEERRFLEQIVHPRIRARLEKEIERLREEGQTPAVVLDAALLFETQWNTLCDEILFVDVPREMRLERARRSRGWTDEQFAWREAAQWDTERKRQAADVVIDNSQDFNATFEQVDRWWRARFPAEQTGQPHLQGAPNEALTE